MDENNEPGRKLEDYPMRYCPVCGPGAGYMGVATYHGEPYGYYCRKCLKVYGRDDPRLEAASQGG